MSPVTTASQKVRLPSLSQPTSMRTDMAWRLGWIRIDSSRVRVTLTGASQRVAARAAWCWTDRSSLPPKPPPGGTSTTRTASSSTPSTDAIWRLSENVPWVPESTVSVPWVSGGSGAGTGPAHDAGTASADSGSRNACSTNGVSKVSPATWTLMARAASSSPRSTTGFENRLPPGCSRGAPPASASAGEVTGGRGWISTVTAAAPRRAAALESATTSANTSPT